jgi:hypothetical protein
MMDKNDRGPPDGPLSAEELERISQLTTQQIAAIDEILLSLADHHWRKVAFIVGSAMMNQNDRVQGIPDTFYSQRVTNLVQLGLLEAQGNLDYMRLSEVRRTVINTPEQ